jgi:hypothetical protein
MAEEDGRVKHQTYHMSHVTRHTSHVTRHLLHADKEIPRRETAKRISTARLSKPKNKTLDPKKKTSMTPKSKTATRGNTPPPAAAAAAAAGAAAAYMVPRTHRARLPLLLEAWGVRY